MSKEEHVSVPCELLEELMWTWKLEAQAHAEKGNYVRCDLTHKHADELKDILSLATPSDEDDGEGGNCEVCGSPVRYGSRHHRCGDAMLRAEKRGRESVQTSAPRVVTGEVDRLLVELHDYADNSDDHCYGTLATSLVRDYVAKLREAFATSLPAEKKE